MVDTAVRGAHGPVVGVLPRRAVLVGAGSMLSLAAVGAGAHGRQAPPPFVADFSGPDRLITNEFAHFNPGHPAARRSPDWDVTSGSLFARDGAGWTGTPDARVPNARSSDGTGSSVFRTTTRRHDLRDVTVSLRLRNLGLTGRGRMPPSDIDGVHVFLRYQNPANLYAVSLNRRDDTTLVKRKLPGGADEGGRYVLLGSVAHAVPYGDWQPWTVGIGGAPGAEVVITVALGGEPILSVADTGAAGPPIRDAGAVGLRGDNCEFEFEGFRADPA